MKTCSLTLLAAVWLSTLAAQQNPESTFCRPGPWGKLEYSYLYIEAPDHLMKLVKPPSEKTTWYLPGMSAIQIEEFLTRCGMERSAAAALVQHSLQIQNFPPHNLFPPPEMIESLSPVVRSNIYRELRKHRRNTYQHKPVVIESGDVGKWFHDSSIGPDTIATIKKLSYRAGDSLVFSDVPYLLTKVKSDEEEKKLLKVLSRTRSLFLHLHVESNTDFDQLQQYWTIGNRQSGNVPFLRTLRMKTPGMKIDITNLLPATPRKHIYTFAPASLGMEGIYPDAYWTAFNFFLYDPDNAFNDTNVIGNYLNTHFRQVQPPYQYGDIMLLFAPHSNATIHACVYIADDILFTKNDRSTFSPFIFMKQADLISRFSLDYTPTVEIWRRIPPQ